MRYSNLLLAFLIAVCGINAQAAAWDGTTKTEPSSDNGVYQIAIAEELAWFAEAVNNGANDLNAELTADIDLNSKDWMPIGYFPGEYTGNFEGNGHRISGLFINMTESVYETGLFSYVRDGSVSNVNVEGDVTGNSNVALLVGSLDGASKITGCTAYGTVKGIANAAGIVGIIAPDNSTLVDRCANYADVSVTDSYVGGVVGQGNNVISNSYNVGKISGLRSGGFAGSIFKADFSNVFTIGELSCFNISEFSPEGAIKISNMFSTSGTPVDGETLVTMEQMRSGEIAYKLGEAFGQEIGVDEHPVLGGMKVYYNAATDTYTNSATTGIENIAVDRADAVYYNMQGVSSDRPFKGVNIVRYGDGTSRKIFVR